MCDNYDEERCQFYTLSFFLSGEALPDRSNVLVLNNKYPWNIFRTQLIGMKNSSNFSVWGLVQEWRLHPRKSPKLLLAWSKRNKPSAIGLILKNAEIQYHVQGIAINLCIFLLHVDFCQLFQSKISENLFKFMVNINLPDGRNANFDRFRETCNKK
mgnify:CR=1 FL=1